MEACEWKGICCAGPYCLGALNPGGYGMPWGGPKRCWPGIGGPKFCMCDTLGIIPGPDTPGPFRPRPGKPFIPNGK